MKLRFGIFLLFLIITAGCSHEISLADELGCSKLLSIEDTKVKSDFNKNFKIEIPNNWKHKGYFDDYQSSLFAADTMKQLTETYIIDVAYKYGGINIDASFSSLLNKNNSLQVLQSNTEIFKGFTAYWQVSKGEKNGYSYHLFDMFVEVSEQGYIEIKSEFYGSELVDERLCESLAIINTLELIQ